MKIMPPRMLPPERFRSVPLVFGHDGSGMCFGYFHSNALLACKYNGAKSKEDSSKGYALGHTRSSSC